MPHPIHPECTGPHQRRTCINRKLNAAHATLTAVYESYFGKPEDKGVQDPHTPTT